MAVWLGCHVLAGSLHAEMAHTERTVGWVMEATGEWIVEGPSKRPIRQGEGVTPGMVIRAGTVDETSKISVCFSDGSTEGRDCKIKGACAVPLSIAVPVEQTGYNRLFDVVAERLARDPGRYVQAQARGTDDEPPAREQVTRADGGRIDLRSAVRSRPGRYRVEFRAVGKDDALGTTPARVEEVEWGPESQPRWVTAPPPGLYSVSAVSVDEEDVVKAVPWVLVATSEQFPGQAAQFAECVRMTESWRSRAKIPWGAIRGVRQACLESLLEMAL